MPAVPGNANDFVEQQLDARIAELEVEYRADIITFSGPIIWGVDDLLRSAVEKKWQDKPYRRKLVVCLTTGGGYIEVVQRIVDTLRRNYKLVDFIVPNHAFSAGTVLAMSGDAIHMDYYSRLGSIDHRFQFRARSKFRRWVIWNATTTWLLRLKAERYRTLKPNY